MPELYVITPRDVLVTFLAGLSIALLAMAGMWWVMRAPASSAVRPADPAGESAETVEIRRRPRRHRTGTIHAPGVDVPPDETVVLDVREVRS